MLLVLFCFFFFHFFVWVFLVFGFVFLFWFWVFLGRGLGQGARPTKPFDQNYEAMTGFVSSSHLFLLSKHHKEVPVVGKCSFQDLSLRKKKRKKN